MKSRRKHSSRRNRSRLAQRRNYQQPTAGYEQLEARQLLSVDVGLSFDGAMMGVDTPAAQPFVMGDVGINHIVELINGRYTVYDKATGAEVQTKEFNQFWADAGAVFNEDARLSNPRVIFDHDTQRWFATTYEPSDSNFSGEIYVGISQNVDPTLGWNSIQFNASPGPISVDKSSSLSVDGNAVYVTVDIVAPEPFGGDSTAIFAFPKDDLTQEVPSTANIIRIEGLDPEVYGTSVQVAAAFEGITGRAFALGTFEEGGTKLTLTEIVGDIAGGGSVNVSFSQVDVPEYLPAPSARQPNGAVELQNTSPRFTGNVVAANGYVWAAHSVLGQSGANSAIRWYQFSQATAELVNTGTIDNADFDFLSPAIAVNKYGTGVAINFTASGETLFPSAYTAQAVVANGLVTPTVQFSFPSQLLKHGLSTFEQIDSETGFNAWTQFSATRIDPVDPFSFWTFTEYANLNDTWTINIAEASIFDISPTLYGNDLNNFITIRRSENNADVVEILMDGHLTDAYEISALDRLIVDGGKGNDTITIDESFGKILAEENITIRGGMGLDTLNYIDTSGHIFNINGNAGGNIDGKNLFFSIERIIGTQFDDIFNVTNSTTNWTIFGNEGNDQFNFSETATGTILLEGGIGNDTYRLPLINIANYTIIDSINQDFDRVIAFGTASGDIITIDGGNITFNGLDVSIVNDFIGIESVEYDASLGDDQFRILSTLGDLNVFGGEGDDEFIVSSDAPANLGNTDGIIGSLNIDGGQGLSRLLVSNYGGSSVQASIFTNQIVGMTAAPINYSGTFSTQNGLAGIVLTGSNAGQDEFDVRALRAINSLSILGADGNDIMTVRKSALGRIDLDGQDGTDTYRSSAASQVRTINVMDTGGDAGLDRIALSLTSSSDDILLANEQLNLLGEFFLWDQNVEKLILDTREGDDVVRIGINDTTFVRVMMNDGNDTAIVQNSMGIQGLKIEGDAGADTFDLRTSAADTFIQALGGTGNDSFAVKDTFYSQAKLDGQEGNDEVTVQFARRATRRIDARDSGGGSDALTVLGSELIDRGDLLMGAVVRSGESVIYDQATENLTINFAGNSDVLNVLGVSAANVNVLMGSGSDNVFVESTTTGSEDVNLVIDLGNGNDTANIYSVAETSTVSIFGQQGSDNFNVGSTLAEDNGNFGRLRGQLKLFGGDAGFGVDRVYLNDNGVQANFNYFMNDSVVTNLNLGSMSPRPQFEAVRFSQMERVRLDGSKGDNFFSVQESLTTEFHIDGNDSGDFLYLGGNIANRQLFANGDMGFYQFNNGSEKITFEKVSGYVPGFNT